MDNQPYSDSESLRLNSDLTLTHRGSIAHDLQQRVSRALIKGLSPVPKKIEYPVTHWCNGLPSSTLLAALVIE